MPSVSIRASVEKAPGLLIPNSLPRCVGYLHEVDDIVLLKATGEVPAGGRVRNALGARPVEEGLIIAPQFDILQPHSVEQRVVGQIQHMVALMIRKVLLKQMQPGVDLLPQPSLLTIRWIAPRPPQLTALAFSAIS